MMTPADWGKPIDVDEKWIHLVDDNVKASKFRLTSSARGVSNEVSISAQY